MSDNYTAGTVTPYFPTKIVEKYEYQFPPGTSLQPCVGDSTKTYIFCEEYCEDWEDLAIVIQKMLIDWNKTSDNDAPTCACIEVAYFCTKMAQGEFGGFAYLITEEDTYFNGIGTWLGEKAEDLGLTLPVC